MSQFFGKLRLPPNEAEAISAPNAPPGGAAASPGRPRLPPGGRARITARPGPSPPPQATESTHFSAKKALRFAISVLQNRTKKQFFLQKPTSKPRKGRNNPYLLAHRNFLFLHLQMKHHGEKAKQTRFTQPRLHLTSNSHCE